MSALADAVSDSSKYIQQQAALVLGAFAYKLKRQSEADDEGILAEAAEAATAAKAAVNSAGGAPSAKRAAEKAAAGVCLHRVACVLAFWAVWRQLSARPVVKVYVRLTIVFLQTLVRRLLQRLNRKGGNIGYVEGDETVCKSILFLSKKQPCERLTYTRRTRRMF